ncbi:MAG: redoxin family protein [Silanimonas sp.]
MTLAPEWQVSQWFNAPKGLSLDSLRGRVVLLHAFQMLCPGCVSHGLPQAAKVRALFDPSDVAVIGLHSVFEHHAVMGPDALGVFLHEYRVDYPVGVDAHVAGDPLPRTMRAYGWRGTPSVTLIDRAGRVRLSHFGRLDDLQLGGMIGRLIAEAATAATSAAGGKGRADAVGGCDAEGCALPP